MLKLPAIRYKESRVPKDEDIGKIIARHASLQEKAWFYLLVDCGIRLNELATIKRTSVNLEDMNISILGKGNKQRMVYFSETPVNLLIEYLVAVKSEYLFSPTRNVAAIKYKSQRYFANRLEILSNKESVDHLSPHQLRHYFASYTLSHGGDVKAVNEMLGYANVTITLEVYHHANAESIKKCAQHIVRLAAFINDLLSQTFAVPV